MSQHEENKLEYVVCCIGAFAKRFAISNAVAYRYLSTFMGLDFIYKHYDVEHTQSIEDAVEDMGKICMRHGGALLV